MAKQLIIRIKIHHGKVAEPVDDDSPEGLNTIIAKVVAAIVAVLAIIIVVLPDDRQVSDPKNNLQKITQTSLPAIQTLETKESQIAATAPANPAEQIPQISKPKTIQASKLVLNKTKPKQSQQTRKPNNKPHQPRTNTQLITAQFTSGVKKLKPIDNLGNTIQLKNNKTSKIYYHTVIKGQKGKKITHRWIYNGKTVANISSKITQKRQVMYSSKKISTGMTGNWEVQIIGPNNQVLKSNKFIFTTK